MLRFRGIQFLMTSQTSETAPEELARRFRYMIEREGHWIDNAGDGTERLEWVTARRWVHNGVVAIIDRVHNRLEIIRNGGGYGTILVQDSGGKISHEPGLEHNLQLLDTLRALMVLDELADV